MFPIKISVDHSTYYSTISISKHIHYPYSLWIKLYYWKCICCFQILLIWWQINIIPEEYTKKEGEILHNFLKNMSIFRIIFCSIELRFLSRLFWHSSSEYIHLKSVCNSLNNFFRYLYISNNNMSEVIWFNFFISFIIY